MNSIRQKLLFVLWFAFCISMTRAIKAKYVEIIVTTKIKIKEDNAKDLMVLVHEDCKKLGKKYLNAKGVKDVETEVLNKTLVKKLSAER
ncbi:hypothetical protein ACFLYU_00315 [Candidatus Dependentiae bacterium]